MGDQIFCVECDDFVSKEDTSPADDQGAICNECDQLLKCPRCSINYKITSNICICGFDFEDPEDEGDDLYPNGRDFDAEDEESN